MQNQMRLIAIATGLAVISSMATGAALAATGSGNAGAAGKTVYTAAQAAKGGTVYARQCANCHAANLQGNVGPALKGSSFHQMAAAQQLTGASLLAVISQSMPKDSPGSLTQTNYADVTAYILKQNGYSAGANKLSAGSPQLKALSLTNPPSSGH